MFVRWFVYATFKIGGITLIALFVLANWVWVFWLRLICVFVHKIRLFRRRILIHLLDQIVLINRSIRLFLLNMFRTSYKILMLLNMVTAMTFLSRIIFSKPRYWLLLSIYFVILIVNIPFLCSLYTFIIMTIIMTICHKPF